MSLEPENQKKGLFSKFLNNAKKSNINVRAPESINENDLQKSFTKDPTDLPSTKQGTRSVLSSMNSNTISNTKSSDNSENTSLIDKYNVHAFPFIPRSTTLPFVPRILKVCNLVPGFTSELFYQLCKSYGEIIMAEYYEGIGYAAYFTNSQAESAFKNLQALFLAHLPGATVEHIYTIDKVSYLLAKALLPHLTFEFRTIHP